MTTADGPATDAPAGRRPRLLFWLPGLVFVVLVGLFAVRLGSGDPSRLPSALIGRRAPAIDLPPLPGLRRDGEPVPGLPAASLRDGRVSVVNVWASWCGPCRAEHPLLTELARDPSFRVVGLNYKDKDETARRFLGTFGNPFAAVGQDPTGRTGIEWGVYGVPETFVVGPDGTIRHKHVGPLTPADLPGFLAAIRRAAGQ